MEITKQEKLRAIKIAIATCFRTILEVQAAQAKMETTLTQIEPIRDLIEKCELLIEEYNSHLSNNKLEYYGISSEDQIKTRSIEPLVKQSEELLNEFEDEFLLIHGTLKGNVEQLQEFRGELEEKLKLAMEAVSLESLDQIGVPSPEWALTIPVVEAYTLETQWTEANLHANMLEYKKELCDLLRFEPVLVWN